MNGVHDMGGMHGMGPIVLEENEPVFHHKWERRVFAVTLAAAFLDRWNLDMSRHAREQMPPSEYLAASYYQRWLWGLERLLVEKGLLTREGIAARLRAPGGRGAGAAATRPAPEGVRVLKAADVETALRKEGDARVDEDIPPRFTPGDHVVTRNIHPVGHTRLPRYARGKRGVIDGDHGVWVFPDARAREEGKQPQHCYSVRFTARELWGPEAPSRHAVYIDLFDHYLDPA